MKIYNHHLSEIIITKPFSASEYFLKIGGRIRIINNIKDWKIIASDKLSTACYFASSVFLLHIF